MPKNFIILGAGESGVGAAILAKRQGYDVWVSDAGSIKEPYKEELDEYGIRYEEGKHSEERVLGADEIMKSPGIPEKNEMMKKVRSAGIPVISEIELAHRFKGQSRILAVTGSNGKSTTTALAYHICKTGGMDCALVGNIGISFAKQVALDPKELYVAEVSSFQLDDIVAFRPDVSVLLNITEDHLDRYEYKFENYIASKFRITMNQQASDQFVYCADDPVTTRYLKQHIIKPNPLPFSMNQEPTRGANGAYIKDQEMTIRTGDEPLVMSVDDFAIKGKHNQYNTMAAGVAASTLGIRKDKIREAVTTFQSLEHRMEFVASVRGVDFINDSKATNVNSTWYALESMTKPTVLILGGVDKGNDYSLLEEGIRARVKAIVCLGVDNTKIHEALDSVSPRIVDTESAPDAVRTAFSLAAKGDVVLLSPACASFDLFKNYEDRGHQFKEAVKDL